MKKFFLGALAIAGLVACVQTEEVGVSNPTDGQIAFGGYVGNQSRATDHSTDLSELKHFTVWGYQTSSAGKVFDNELVTYNETTGAWTYEGTQYWQPGHDYRFFAITPYELNEAGENVRGKVAITPSADPIVDGLGTITFENIEGKEDVLYASKTESTKTSIPEKVTFQFNHLLSKVKFTFTNGYDGEFAKIAITDVTMEVPKKGTVELNESVKTQHDWTIVGDEKTTLEFRAVANGKHLENSESAQVDNELLTIPAGVDQTYKVTFTVTVYQGEPDAEGKQVATEHHFESIIADKELVAGTAYNFTATIDAEALNAKAIVFDAAVDAWEQDVPEDTELGYYKDVNSDTYVVTSSDGLKRIAEEINAGVETDRNITLSEDIDLSAITRAASNWTPIGTEDKPFTGTFDGKNFTIKNLNVVETEAKEGKAYIGFFGYAKNATIKNVVFENVNINIACLDIDHSQGHIGAVAGSLEGTSTIENVTVKGDIKVEATQSANGASRVAVIAGGNSYGNVTMENVHVIANEGSYLIANNNTGALAGQLQGKAVCKNCSSNINVTVNKFFAGGLIGLAAGDQLFENCHTTGDIAVVAGREGRAHDQYRVGGIAGGWADGAKNVCTLVNCSYTGKLTGVNSDGSVAEKFDYMGYVGRGYTLNGCQGSKVVIDGISFIQAGNTAAEAGVYNIQVSTAAALKTIATKVNGGEYYAGETILLGADIDLNNQEWTPIGSAYADHGFMGNFDGNGFTIKNLNISTLTPDADGFVYAGLFGVTEGVDASNQNYIKNLVIENVTINTTGDIAAAAVAYPYYTVIENVTVKGNISIKGGNYTSGVLAYTRRCVDAKNISIEANEGSVIEGNMTVGGVISDIQMNGGLKANYSNFSASGLTIKAVKNVGGISGIIAGQLLDGANVENVTIDCNDARKGIVSGALGEVSTIKNISYSNVIGADKVVGATYDEPASEVVNNGDVYSKKE